MHELLILLISSVTGILGYFFREWQNRVTPFIEVLTIDGTTTKGTDTIEIEDDSLIDIGKGCEYLDTFTKKMTLSDIYSLHKQCLIAKYVYSEFNDKLNEILYSSEPQKIEKIFSRLCSSETFDNYLTKAIAGDRLKPYKNVNNQNAIRYNVIFDANEEKGTYWIPFENNTTTLGNRLNTEALKIKFQDLIDIIIYWDVDGIKHYIKQLQSLIDKHNQAANQIYPFAEKFINENSRWIFKLSVINLNDKPILIGKRSQLIVKSKLYKPIVEDCYLLTFGEKGNYVDVEYPVIINSGETKEIGFITEKRQCDMEKGDAIRGVYKSKKGKMIIALEIIKVGLFRKQIFHTPSVVFSKDKDE